MAPNDTRPADPSMTPETIDTLLARLQCAADLPSLPSRDLQPDAKLW